MSLPDYAGIISFSIFAKNFLGWEVGLKLGWSASRLIMKYDLRARFGIYYLHWNQQRSSCLEHSYVGRRSKILISKSEFFNEYRIQPDPNTDRKKSKFWSHGNPNLWMLRNWPIKISKILIFYDRNTDFLWYEYRFWYLRVEKNSEYFWENFMIFFFKLSPAKIGCNPVK